jgi:hypothetical protein
VGTAIIYEIAHSLVLAEIDLINFIIGKYSNQKFIILINLLANLGIDYP